MDLISGAAKGIGLGHDFLRHIERTRLLIHLIDGASEDPVLDLNVVEKELAAYGHGLVDRPGLLVLNKIELLNQQVKSEVIELLQKTSDRKLILVSAAMGKGLDTLLDQVWKQLEK